MNRFRSFEIPNCSNIRNMLLPNLVLLGCFVRTIFCFKQTGGQTDRHTDRQRDRQKCGHTDIASSIQNPTRNIYKCLRRIFRLVTLNYKLNYKATHILMMAIKSRNFQQISVLNLNISIFVVHHLKA